VHPPSLLPLLALAAACSSGDSSSSNCNQTATLTTSVIDGADDNPICNATVTATLAGGSPQPMMPSPGKSAQCTYVLAGVQAGQYEIAASAPGYMNAHVSLTIGIVGCSVEAPSTSLTLMPSQ